MKENALNKIPLKIYRDIRFKGNLYKEYKDVKKNFSKEYAKIYYEADYSVYKYGSADVTYKKLSVKDDYIINYIQNLCGDVIEKYKNTVPIAEPTSNRDGNIWIYWWQGESDMPEIVKACVKSIRENSAGRNVVFIDKNNYSDFVEISKTVEKKHNDGIIGHPHFSDIVRHSLLAKYGGIWIDTTVFLSQQLPEYVFERTFYTAKSVDEKLFFFSRSRWVGYFLGGSKDFLLFSFVRDMLTAYWERTDKCIDYLLMDYIFETAYGNIPQVKNEFDLLENNNLLRGKLMSEINSPYSSELFDTLKNGDTFISKLSYRYGNPKKETETGELTNYGHLINL